MINIIKKLYSVHLKDWRCRNRYLQIHTYITQIINRHLAKPLINNKYDCFIPTKTTYASSRAGRPKAFRRGDPVFFWIATQPKVARYDGFQVDCRLYLKAKSLLIRFINKYLAAFIASILLGALLTSCLPAVIIGGGIAGTTIAEERTAGDKLNDNVIKLKIKDAYIRSNTSIYSDVDINVYEGRVLLTGSVESSRYAKKAYEIASSIENIKEVINEIEVSSKGMRDSAKDILIANTIRSRLLVEKDLQSLNYIVEVNKGNAYLLGVAKSQAELNKAITIARNTKGVRKVINYVWVKSPKINSTATTNTTTDEFIDESIDE